MHFVLIATLLDGKEITRKVPMPEKLHSSKWPEFIARTVSGVVACGLAENTERSIEIIPPHQLKSVRGVIPSIITSSRLV